LHTRLLSATFWEPSSLFSPSAVVSRNE
jgi:hypothetical protein